MNYGKLAGSIGGETAPGWAPGATWDGNASRWRVSRADLAGRAELDRGEKVLAGDVVVGRGGEHDRGWAGELGLYYATRGGAFVHRDGSWAAGALDPAIPAPRKGDPRPGRESFTGFFDDLPSLLSALGPGGAA